MHTRRERYTQTVVRHGYKKRGDRLLPVPRIEALRLPVVIRTSNHRPHADMNTILPTQRNMYIHTPWASTVAMFSDDNLKFLRFLCVKNKA
jgi:hypothetical protein